MAFCAVLHLPHKYTKNTKRISRIVTLPDYQGIGIGNAMLNEIAKSYIDRGFRMAITTTTPSLIHSFDKSPNWQLTRQGRVPNYGSKGFGESSSNRITTAWEYKKVDKA